MSDKKLYQVIKEKQVIAVLLAASQDQCKEYLQQQGVIDNDMEYIDISEVSKQERASSQKVIPLMVAKKSSWYDLRHYKHLYIYEDE